MKKHKKAWLLLSSKLQQQHIYEHTNTWHHNILHTIFKDEGWGQSHFLYHSYRVKTSVLLRLHPFLRDLVTSSRFHFSKTIHLHFHNSTQRHNFLKRHQIHLLVPDRCSWRGKVDGDDSGSDNRQGQGPSSMKGEQSYVLEEILSAKDQNSV